MNLVFINFYQGLSDRGGETYVHELAERLGIKNTVTVFQTGSKKNNKNYQVEEIKINFDPNHPHGRLPVTHILKRLFLDYFHLKELVFTLKLLPKLSALKPDVVFPQNSGWEVLLIKIFCLFSGAKLIVAGQSGPGWNDKVNLFVRPSIFVALTTRQAEWAKKVTLWKNQNIIVIPNGVDTQRFSPKGDKYQTDLASPIVLAVGAAIKSKRIKSTIYAVANLEKVSLLVVGTGPDEQEEDTLGQKLLGSRYQRIKVKHAEMPNVYRSADVFTLCSDSSEAFGIVYLEALASGLPCVVTDDQSRKEILGGAGIYVSDPENASEYSQKIDEALKIKSSEKFTSQAEKFTWDSVSEKYCDILK